MVARRLLELAALAGTLIADDTTIYDPRLFNDRLLLGCVAPVPCGARSTRRR